MTVHHLILVFGVVSLAYSAWELRREYRRTHPTYPLTLYVAPNGDDDNDCLRADDACRTFEEVLNRRIPYPPRGLVTVEGRIGDVREIPDGCQLTRVNGRDAYLDCAGQRWILE